jgi:hypothetical protein
MSDGVYADPRGIQDLAARLRQDVAGLRVCAAHVPLALPGDDGGVTAATGAFLDAEAQVGRLTVDGVDGFANRLEATAAAGYQADVFMGR